MLKDRVQLTQTGFKVLAEKGRENCRAYYGEFSLRDDPDAVPGLNEIPYWNAVSAPEAKISPKRFVLVQEKEDGRVVESCRFFFSGNQGKSHLRTTIQAVRRYGRNAQKITIEWIDCRAESINNRYIYLTDSLGERYYFLREVIQPLEPDGKKLMDQYIFWVPDGHQAEEYQIETDPLIRQKYSVET